MSKVRFNLKNKSDNPSQIYLIYWDKCFRTPFRYYTGEKVPPNFWNGRKMRPKLSASYVEGKRINAALDKLERDFNKVWADFHKKDVIPSKQRLRESLDNAFKGSGKTNGLIDNVNDYAAFFLKKRKESPKYTKGSCKVYNTTVNKLKEYLGRKRMYFSDLDIGFYRGFEDFLVGKGYTDNYIHKMVTTLRTIVNDAVRNPHISSATVNPYESQALEIKKRQSDNVYLNLNELEELYQFDLSENKRLERVRDLFIVACFTGLRYSDFSRLKPKHLIKLDSGKSAFEVITEKTSEKVIIPLHPKVKSILDKYNGKLPTISEQNMNAYLKELGEMVGFNSRFTRIEYFGGGSVENTYKKY